jgi:glycosyltransferase involved in cell wall biosynthesis
MSKNIDLSIVIPLFNEQEVIPFLLEELNKTGQTLGKSYEIIFVDDGSTDKTFELVKKAADQDPKFKVIKLSRNFGHQAAFNVGIDPPLLLILDRLALPNRRYPLQSTLPREDL